MREVLEKDFDKFISGKNCLVKFGATWCMPCKAVKSVLKKVESITGVDVFLIDIEDFPKATLDYNIRNLPTVVAFKNGKAVNEVVGKKEILAYANLAKEIK